MDRKKRRMIELGKDAVIVLLLLSALWLIGRPQLYGRQVEEWLSSALQRGSGTAGVVTDSVDVTQLLRPVRMAVMTDQGRYGTAYDSQGTQLLFSTAADLLNEALTSAQEPQRVSRQVWEDALGTAPGIYYEFAGALPLSVMADLMSGGESGSQLDGVSARVSLCVRQDEVQLIYLDETDGYCYAAATDVVSTAQLSSAARGYTANGTQFAFEREDCSSLAFYTMLPSQTPQPAECLAVNPLTAEETGASVLEQLGFGVQGTSHYEAPDGTVYLNSGDTLRLGNDGRVTFTAGEASPARFSVSTVQEEASPAENMELIYQLVRQVAVPWQGDAELQLTRYERQEDGSVWVEFEYYIGGAQVIRGDGSPAVSAVLQDGAVTDLVFCLRTYTQSGSLCAVLPVTQAAAAVTALEGEGGELLLCYRDNGGGTVSAGWVVTR